MKLIYVKILGVCYIVVFEKSFIGALKRGEVVFQRKQTKGGSVVVLLFGLRCGTVIKLRDCHSHSLGG